MHDEQSMNHISLKERYAYIDVQKSPTTQDAFWPIPGLISCAGVAGSWGLLSHAHIQLETVAGVSVMTCLKRPGYKASKDSLVHTYEWLGYKASKSMGVHGYMCHMQFDNSMVFIKNFTVVGCACVTY